MPKKAETTALTTEVPTTMAPLEPNPEGPIRVPEKYQSMPWPYMELRDGFWLMNDTIEVRELVGVIAGDRLEYAYYPTAYDRSDENPDPPKCFALGDDGTAMAPHAAVNALDRQAETCKVCKWNQWGSADAGKGKKCGQRFRVAFVQVPFERDAGAGKIQAIGLDQLGTLPGLRFRVSPGGMKVYKATISNAITRYGHPIDRFVWRITTEPDWKISYKPFGVLEDYNLDLLRSRVDEVQEILTDVPDAEREGE